jgi:hypothetical protein
MTVAALCLAGMDLLHANSSQYQPRASRSIESVCPTPRQVEIRGTNRYMGMTDGIDNA